MTIEFANGAKTVGELISALLSFDKDAEIYTAGDYDGNGHLYALHSGEWLEVEIAEF